MTAYTDFSVLDPAAAVAAADAASQGPSPFDAAPYLVLDFYGVLSADGPLQAWLRSRPCPVIGLAPDDLRHPLVEACDLRVADRAAAALLVTNILHSPIAAMVLVQLLRNVESQPLEAALLAESLAYSTLQAGPEFRRWLTAHRAAAPTPNRDPGPAVVIERDADTLSLCLNRPGNRNGMTVEMRDALIEALQLVQADASIERVILSGAGKCFSTGGDLSEFGSAPDPASAHVVRSLALPGRLLAQCASRVEARLHGACIGSGIEFPAFAGRVLAASGTYFQLPELRFGLIPGAGGTVSVTRRLGRQRAAWMMISGQRVNTAQALAWGLIDGYRD